MGKFGRKGYTVDEATRRAERYCAYQERCHQEVASKLREMGMIPQAVDTILAHLIRENFLNEERFALAFTRGKFRQKAWGRIRIGRELKQRGITEYLVRKALASIPVESYLETFERLADTRLRLLEGESPERRRKKLYDYLFYRGWESDLILNYLERNGLLG